MRLIAVNLCVLAVALAESPRSEPYAHADGSSQFQAIHAETSSLRDFIRVEDFGGQGDGRDDTVAVQCAADVAMRTGHPLLIDRVYGVTKSIQIHSSIWIMGQGSNTGFIFLRATDPYNNHILAIDSPVKRTYTATHHQVEAGQTTLQLDAIDGIKVGETVLLLLGTDPYDHNEENLRLFAEVRAIDRNAVKLNLAIPEKINGLNHKLLTFNSIAQNVKISNLSVIEPNIPGNRGVDGGIFIRWARNITIDTIFSDNAPSEVLNMVESENIVISNLYCTRSFAQVPNQLYDGKVIYSWGTRRVSINNLFAQDIPQFVIYCESECRDWTVRNVTVEDSDYWDNALYGAIDFTGGSTGIVVENYRFSSASAAPRPPIVVGPGTEVFTRDVTLDVGASRFPTNRHSGYLKYRGVTFFAAQHWQRPFVLAGSSMVMPLPVGVYQRARVYLSSTSGIVKAQITNSKGKGADITRTIASGKMMDVTDQYIGEIGTFDSFNDEYDDAKTLSFIGAGLSGYGVIEIDYWPYLGGKDGDVARFENGTLGSLDEVVFGGVLSPSGGAPSDKPERIGEMACPAVDCTKPYAWIKVIVSGGGLAYLPLFR